MENFLAGKGETYLYLAMQQIGSYKDQLAVDSVQIALKVDKF